MSRTQQTERRSTHYCSCVQAAVRVLDILFPKDGTKNVLQEPELSAGELLENDQVAGDWTKKGQSGSKRVNVPAALSHLMHSRQLALPIRQLSLFPAASS